MIRLCIEIANGLPTSEFGFHSDKVNRLRDLWSKLNADFSSLVENQINPSLLTNKDSLHATMLKKNHSVTSILGNNKNELIGKR